MRWEIETCPECGEEASGTVESLMGVAMIERLHGEFQYSGYTDVLWDAQKSVTKDGKELLVCGNGHEWYSQRIKDAEE